MACKRSGVQVPIPPLEKQRENPLSRKCRAPKMHQNGLGPGSKVDCDRIIVPSMRKPFYRKQTKCWYVKSESGKTFIRLDPDKRKAFDLWHRMQAATVHRGPAATVLGILNAFVEELQPTLSEARFAALKHYAESFVRKHASDLAMSITPATVIEWLNEPQRAQEKKSRKPKEKDAKPEYRMAKWSESSKRHAAALIKRAWKWAHNQGRLPANHLASLKLPECQYRDATIDYATHERLVLHCRQLDDSKPFALYLIASRCGARPQQIREVTAANVQFGATQWVFKKHKTVAKTGKDLRVYLSPCLQTLTKILLSSRPSGPLFRNANGDPWKSDTVTQRMERLRKRLKLPPGTVVYLYRHTMATNALLAGQTTATVAALLGHVDTRMVSKVYGHLDNHSPHLLDAAAKAHAKDQPTLPR